MWPERLICAQQEALAPRPLANDSDREIPWPKKTRQGCREPRRSFVLWRQSARTGYLIMRKIAAITHSMQSPGAFQ